VFTFIHSGPSHWSVLENELTVLSSVTQMCVCVCVCVYIYIYIMMSLHVSEAYLEPKLFLSIMPYKDMLIVLNANVRILFHLIVVGMITLTDILLSKLYKRPCFDLGMYVFLLFISLMLLTLYRET
jgi:hypothetical protein